MVLTQNGIALKAKAEAGAELSFTRVGIGDGTLPGGTTLNSLTALVNETKSLDISSINVTGVGQVTLKTSFTNSGQLVDLYVREIGLFATDPDDGEILYSVANAGDTADFIPAEGTDIIEEALNLVAIIGNAEDVTAVINSSLVYATAQDLEDLRTETDSAIELIADDLAGHKAETATQEDLGHVKVDGITIKADANGVISGTSLDATRIRCGGLIY